MVQVLAISIILILEIWLHRHTPLFFFKIFFSYSCLFFILAKELQDHFVKFNFPWVVTRFALKYINFHWNIQFKNMVRLCIYLGFLLYASIKFNSSLSTSPAHFLMGEFLRSLSFCFHCKCNHLPDFFSFLLNYAVRHRQKVQTL